MLTLAYTDIVGSTEAADRLGEAEAHRQLLAQRALVETCAAAVGGFVAQDLGDGLQLVFPEPSGAIRCAVDVQRHLYEAAQRDPTGTARLRIGIHTGNVLREGNRYMGRAAILAQRVMSVAGAGEILVSAATQRLAPDLAPTRTVSRGRFRLKGLATPVLLFEVIWRAEDVDGRDVARVARSPRWLSEVSDSPFVGRDSEMAALEHHLGRASQGRGRVVLIEGPPGIGKTRLAGELLASVSDRSLLVATGRFAEGPSSPFAAYAECLSSVLRRADAPRVPKHLARELAPLAAVVPELAPSVPIPRRRTLTEATEHRHRLMEAVAQLWLTWSQQRAVALLLDDLHWADPQSFDLLSRLARRLSAESARLLVMTTVRDTASEPSAVVSARLAELRRERATHELALAGLSLDESDLLCRNVAAVGSELRARICTRSAGSPLFIEALSRAVAADPSGAEPSLPVRIQDVIERRLARLTPRCLEALRTAAVFGSEFEVRVLAHALGEEPTELVALIDEAWRARVLTEHRSGYDLSYSFEHGLISECLLQQQSAIRRQEIHSRLADAIIACTPSGAEPPASAMAFHLLRAGTWADPVRIADFTERAGQQASALFAYTEAADLFTGALDACARSREADPLRVARLRADLSWALGRLGQVARAREEADAAIETLVRAGETRTLAEVRLATAAMLGLHAMHGEALQYLEPAIEQTEPQDVLHGEAMARYAIALDGTGAPQPMRSIARRLRALARRLDSRELAERACNVERNWYVNHTAEFTRALRVTRAMAESAEARRDPWYGSMYCNEVAFLLFVRGRVREAMVAASTALERAQRTGTVAEVLNARALRAIVFCFRGEWMELDEEWARAAPDLGRAPGALRVGLLLWARRQADTWLGRADVRAPSPARIYRGMGRAELAVAASTALLAVQRGAPQSASLLEATRAALPMDGAGLLWLIAAQATAAGLAALGLGKDAVPLSQALRPYAGTLYLGSTSLELARLARQQGRLEIGLKNVRAAIRDAKREQLRPLLAQAFIEQAELLEVTGRDGARAKESAIRGLALARELGMDARVVRASGSTRES